MDNLKLGAAIGLTIVAVFFLIDWLLNKKKSNDKKEPWLEVRDTAVSCIYDRLVSATKANQKRTKQNFEMSETSDGPTNSILTVTSLATGRHVCTASVFCAENEITVLFRWGGKRVECKIPADKKAEGHQVLMSTMIRTLFDVDRYVSEYRA